jgi:hypothetical protein
MIVDEGFDQELFLEEVPVELSGVLPPTPAFVAV